jgi:hypothetical protein
LTLNDDILAGVDGANIGSNPWTGLSHSNADIVRADTVRAAINEASISSRGRYGELLRSAIHE